MTFFQDLWATIVIFFSNLNARFGHLFNLLLLALVLLIVVMTLARVTIAGHTFRRRRPLKEQQPNPALTERAAESLSKAVQFPSVTGDNQAMDQLVEYIKRRYADTLEALQCLYLPGGSMLLRWKAGQQTSANPVLFCGHLDVVPPGDGWDGDPFSGKREDGLIHGRGTLDCKNVVIALLESVTALRAEGFAPSRDLYFAFGHDEETGGEGGARAIAEVLTKRGLYFDMILDEGGYISKQHFGSRTYPAALIGVAEKGNCTVKLTANLRSGHAALPSQHTALGILAEAICRLESAPPRGRLLPVVRKHLEMSAPAMSFGKRFAVSNLPFSRWFLFRCFRNDPATYAMFRTTFAATQAHASETFNVLPGAAEAVVNVRVLQGDTTEQILDYVRSLLADLPVTVEMVKANEPSKICADDGEMYQLLCNTITEQFPHLPCIPTIDAKETDSHHYEALSDNILRFMPFVVSNKANESLHNANEYIRETSFGAGIELYQNLMRKL